MNKLRKFIFKFILIFVNFNKKNVLSIEFLTNIPFRCQNKLNLNIFGML
jgi:hypothetical protein